MAVVVVIAALGFALYTAVNPEAASPIALGLINTPLGAALAYLFSGKKN
jgi:hypothetical protein